MIEIGLDDNATGIQRVLVCNVGGVGQGYNHSHLLTVPDLEKALVAALAVSYVKYKDATLN